MQLDHYLKAFRHLKVNINARTKRPSPHKICMLLAVIDQAETGVLTENRITYSHDLLSRYLAYFDAVRTEQDHPNPYFPFFHLKSSGFWHLAVIPGREQAADAITSARSNSAITDNFAYVQLNDDLYALLMDGAAREALGNALAQHWFDRGFQEISRIRDTNRQISIYEYLLRHPDQPRERTIREAPPKEIRDPAFRRIVIEAYDFRCSATGWRVILPDSRVMVEAAHIVPFAESQNDNPRNGLALTPSFHWALDAGAIAPGPDFKWHVSKNIDRRFPENKPLCDLDGTSLILPKDRNYWPKEEWLEWRYSRLA